MYLYVVPGYDALVPEGGIFLNFIELVVFIKNVGKQVLAFFPSKTDLISVTDTDGNVTNETLSERLGVLEKQLGRMLDIRKNYFVCTKELKDITDAEELKKYKVGIIADDSVGNISHWIVTDLLQKTGNTDEFGSEKYTVPAGAIIYSANTTDASEESVGYYRCVETHETILSYAGFDNTQGAFDGNCLKHFVYLGKSSINTILWNDGMVS